MNDFCISIDSRSISAALLRQLHETLRQQDADYEAEKARYLQLRQELREALKGSSAGTDDTLIDALEQRLAAKLTYVSWLGFLMNLECFHFSASKQQLAQDYEELHREAQFGALPQVQQADRAIAAFMQQLPESCREPAEGIQDFFSYLETFGFKLAHYWGFLFSNRFLPDVVPGYAPDTLLTLKYRSMLEQALPFPVGRN